MPFDYLTIAAVRQELERTIIGGRIQGIVAAAPLTLSLEIYRPGVGRTNLVLSAHPQHARIHLARSSSSRDPLQQPPLVLLLKKYARGGIINEVSQPSFERLFELSIAKRAVGGKRQQYHSSPYFRDIDEDDDSEPEAEPNYDGPMTSVRLIIEIIGRLSNIILVGEDGTVMESIKRIPPAINRYRVTLPNHPYVPPPPQSKRDPLTSSINMLSLELSRAEEAEPGALVWKGLVGGFSGVSPTLAREAVYQALGNTRVKAAEIAPDPSKLTPLLEKLQGLFRLEETGFTPQVAWRENTEKGALPLDFASYPLTHLEAEGARIDQYDSISEAVNAHFAALETLGSHSALREQVRAQLDDLKSRDERRLSALRDELQRAEASEELRRKGEMLLGYMHTLEPGQRALVIPEEGLKIELDTSLTPVENAQAYFKAYHKARSAQEGLPALVEQASMRMRFLDELATSLDLASTYDEIRAVQSELALARYPAGKQPPEDQTTQKKHPKGKKPQEKLPQPLKLQTSRGIPLLVGRTALQNDAATFKLAAPDDLWFHVRGAPGSHVIMRLAGAATTLEDIEEAAQLAAAYSSARQEAQVDVVYTERRYVRKVPKSPPGFVTYKNEQVIRVAPKR